MSVWWCNQTRCWDEELAAGVVCSATRTTQPKFRESVSRARKGDIVLHYRSGHGIVAVSRAAADPVRCSDGDRRSICLHGEGWSFPTEYHALTPAIPRDLIEDAILDLEIEDGPILRFKGGRVQVRQAYFMPFTPEALRRVRELAADRDWPSWSVSTGDDTRRPRGSSGARIDAEPLEAIEGLLTEARMLKRSRDRRLRRVVLDAAGGVCAVCLRDFSKLLGGRGQAALHVHHRKQLAATDAPRITTAADLVAVCATCHALIHSDPRCALEVEALRKLLKGEGYVRE